MLLLSLFYPDTDGHLVHFTEAFIVGEINNKKKEVPG
jgi:hypothetical protein